MDFELSEDQRAFQSAAREFAREVFAPNAARWDAEAIFPVEEIRQAGELGFCGLYASETYGGLGLARLDATLVFEELAAVDPSTTAFITIHNMATWMITSWAKPEIAEQMKRFRAACLDIASRAGIQPYMPAPTEHYDPEKHTVPTDAPPPETAARIIRVLAPGFLYQGQLTRKALILTEGMEAAAGEPAGAQGVTHSFASSPFEPAREETSSFTPAEPLEVDNDVEFAQTPEVEAAPEAVAEPEPELNSEEEILAEVESEIELAEEPLDDSEALFRQESFESLSPKPTTSEPEESPAEDEPSEPIEIETEELGEIEESWSQEEPPEEDEPDESPDDEERLPL